jgi:hypothetical protein
MKGYTMSLDNFLRAAAPNLSPAERARMLRAAAADNNVDVAHKLDPHLVRKALMHARVAGLHHTHVINGVVSALQDAGLVDDEAEAN